MSPALAGGFLTTALPGKPLHTFLYIRIYVYLLRNIDQGEQGLFLEGGSTENILYYILPHCLNVFQGAYNFVITR